MRRLPDGGFGLVEALVALGFLTVVLASIVTFQATSLRATRSAAVTLDLAAAAEAEATLRSLLVAPGGDCLVGARWTSVSGCEAIVVCAGDACAVTLHRVTVRAPTGQALTVTSAAAGAETAGGGEGRP